MTTLTDVGSNLGNILYSRTCKQYDTPIPKRQKSEENTDTVTKTETNTPAKIKMWKNAVDPTNATRNKFITVHGNTNEYNLATDFAKIELKESTNTTDNTIIENSGIFYTVPEGIILVDLALDNTVIYSNSLQDMENAVHKSHPNWIITPIFTDEGNVDVADNKINNGEPFNFNDEKQIKVQYGILDEELDETKKAAFLEKLNKIATIEIEKKAEKDNNTSSARTLVKVKTITKDAETNLKKAKLKWGSNKLSDFRQEMVNIAGNIDESIAEPLPISVKIVEEIDKYVVKEEFGLNDDLYTFNVKHPNFDPQGPNMPMLATHIYFPGEKIHNKMMEWDEGKDFNVFNMIDTSKIANKNEIDKKSIHNMLFEEAQEKTSTTSDDKEKEIEIIESYYIENSIKEYPSQIIYNAKSENSKEESEEYSLLKVYNPVNKTTFNPPNREKINWFPLQALIDKITSVENPTKDNPIIIYLNSCSPTIRSTDEIIENTSFQRTRRRRVRNIRRKYDNNSADLKESLKKDDDDVAKKISKYLIQINDLKNEKYEIGRDNFIKLRQQLKTDDEWAKKYKTLTVDDLPRLHKTIVMMGKTERAEWYRNIMGAFFHQLKTPIVDAESKKQQESFEVIYKQAKRDAFNREIYVLRKNWKNYEKARSEENENWPVIKWPDSDNTKCKGEEGHNPPKYMNLTTDEYCGGRKKKTRKKRKKRRRKKTRRKRKKRRRKKTRKRRRRTRRKR